MVLVDDESLTLTVNILLLFCEICFIIQVYVVITVQSFITLLHTVSQILDKFSSLFLKLFIQQFSMNRMDTLI